MKINFLHSSLGIGNSHYAIIRDLTIHKQAEQLQALKNQEVSKVLSNPTNLINSTANIGYKDILKEFNKPDLVPASENLLKMVIERGKLPTINTVVDAYNLIAIKSMLAIGAHDLDKIKGDLTFDFAENGETILGVNMTNPIPVDDGDYVYRDEEKILAWLDVRDSDLAKIEEVTTDVLLIIEGNRKTTGDYIYDHLKEACELIVRFNGGSFEINKILGS